MVSLLLPLRNRAVRIDKRDDLPAPEGPMIVMNDPLLTLPDKLCKMCLFSLFSVRVSPLQLRQHLWTIVYPACPYDFARIIDDYYIKYLLNHLNYIWF